MIDIDKFIEMVEDEYKDKMLGEVPEEYISTGSLSLDLSIGKGGIPIGKVTQIHGSYSSGKTTMSLGIVKSALEYFAASDFHKERGVLYLDAEFGLTKQYVEAIIGEYDEAKLKLLRLKLAEDMFNVIEQAIESGAFGLIVIDSLGSVAPTKEANDKLTDDNVALLARLVTKFLRRNIFSLMKNRVALLIINQVRDNIGSYMGGYSIPGGKALEHACSVVISLTKGTPIKQGDEKIGVLTNFSIKKNKVSFPGRGHTLPIIFGHGVDKERDVLDFATMLGVISKSGSYYQFENETIGHGANKATDALKADPELLDKISQMCYNIVDIL